MQQLFICPKGHRWETDPQKQPESQPLRCPVCGEITQTTAFHALAPAKVGAGLPALHSQETTAFQEGTPGTANGEGAAKSLPVPVTTFQELPTPPPGSTTTAITLLEPGSQARDLSTSVMLRFPNLRREPLAKAWPSLPGYEILEEIGKGATGVVYKAREANYQRLVAIKVILTGDYAEARNFTWLHAQLKAVAALQHSCVMQVYQVGEHEGRPYFVMEYVDGGNLRQKIGGKPQPHSQAVQLVETLARTVHYAEQQGIGHRDLKPNNILLTSDGVPKIADFGMTRRADPAAGNRTQGMGLNGATSGNPCYLAPEQLARPEMRGTTPEVGPATDVYALGAILYEMLTGRPPFQGTTPAETADLVRRAEPLAPSRLQIKISPQLEAICLKCLEKDPRKRYANTDALADDLRRFFTGQQPLARSPRLPQRVWKWARQRQGVAALLAVGALALVCLAVGVLWSRLRMRAQLDTAKAEESEARKEMNQEHRYLFLADMNLAQQAWERNEVPRCLELLERHRPAKGNEDLRGFEWFYLWRLCHSDERTLRGHAGPIYALAVSSDGKTVASGGEIPRGEGKAEGELRLWQAATGKDGTVLKGHAAPVRALAFAPAARPDLLASGDQQGTIKLWDCRTGKEQQTFQGHGGEIRSLMFAPDGETLASGCLDGKVQLWDIGSGKEKATLPGHLGGVSAVAFTPDGKTLAAASLGDAKSFPFGEIKLWDWANRKELGLLQGHHGPVHCLAFAPDGQTLASGGTTPVGAGEVCLWNAATHELRTVLPGYIDAVFTLAFAADSKTLAVGGEEQAVTLWSLDAVPQTELRLKGHTGPVTALAYLPNGRELVTASADATIKIWSLVQAQGGPTIHGQHQPIHALTFAEVPALAQKVPENEKPVLVAVGGQSGKAGETHLWGSGTGADLASLFKGEHQGAVLAAAVGRRGPLLATAGEDTMVNLYDLRTLKLRTILRGHDNWVLSVAFSPRETMIATGSEDMSINLWNENKGSRITSIVTRAAKAGPASQPMGAIMSLAFSPDGTLLAAGGANQLARIWDVTNLSSLREHATLKGHKGAITAVAFSPDGKTLATASRDQTVKLWDVATGKELLTCRGHGHTVTSVAYSPGGATLASGSRDGTVRLWDVRTGLARLVLRGHHGAVTSVVFSPDGKTLASASADRTIKLWQSATESESAN